MLTPNPCKFCAVRADIGCKHRPAEGTIPIALISKNNTIDKRSLRTDQELAAKVKNSKQFDAMIKAKPDANS